jgi:hypothetical protein
MARNILSSTSALSDGNLYGYTLPKALVGIKITQAGQAYLLETTETTLQPDPKHQYYFRYSPCPFTDDDITLEFSPQGYLKRICTIIDDQTDDFINKLAEIGTNLAGSLAGVTTRSLEQRVLLEVKVDPFDEKAMGQLNTYLQQIEGSLELGAVMLGESAPATAGPTQSDRSGVYYKPPGTCELTLRYQGGETSAEARIPHPHLLGFVAIPQAPWVKTSFTMTFDEQGVPNKIEVKKPSTAMAIIEVPINILKAIIAIPTQLIQLRVNLQNDRQQALSEQLTSDKQMKELKMQLDAYREEQQATQTRSVNGNSGSPTSNTRGGAAETPGADPVQLSQMTNKVNKLEQDLLVLRRRLNEQG